MGLTRQWLETKPAITDKIKDGPAEFQARWKDVRELLNSAGITCDSVNPLAEQGRLAVNASGTGINPTIYKSDRATKIIEFTDGGATLLADYLLTGIRNLPEASLADDAVGNVISPTTGYKRAMKPLRTFESSPVDNKVNVRPGNYTKTGGLSLGFYAGGNLTIGIAPLTLPAAGNHAYYSIYLDGAGLLTAVKGTEVLLAATPVAPNFPAFANPIAIVDIKDTSVNFSLLASGANAFLVLDGRVDTSVLAGLTTQVARTLGFGIAVATVAASKSITLTADHVLVILGQLTLDGVAASIAIYRAGVQIAGYDPNGSAGCVFAIDKPGIGAHTYEIRHTGGLTASRVSIAICELIATTVS